MSKGSGRQTGWILVAVACLAFGGVLGYVIATAPRSGNSPAAPAGVQGSADQAAPLVDERQIQTYRDILRRDPKNVEAAVRIGNLLYDAGRYGEAIPAYQQAFALDPRNVNLSTDLGTALWYTGRADEALAQYEKSLAIEPNHAQTLFNMGIVRRDGKRDPKGAIEVWERLLAANPGYAERPKVEQAIAQARQSPATGPGVRGLEPQALNPIR
jgi:cytochrome c-type biogenesis protein CcmH/NrfG